MQHRECRHIGDAGSPARQINTLGETLTVVDEILAEAGNVALFCRHRTPRQHHILHPMHTDQPWNAHRAATTEKNAALALRQSVVRRAFRHADVRRGCEFKPAAHDRTMKHRDHRDWAELDLMKRLVPHLRMQDAAVNVDGSHHLAKIKARAKVSAFAMENNRADAPGDLHEEAAQTKHCCVVERVAFGRS